MRERRKRDGDKRGEEGVREGGEGKAGVTRKSGQNTWHVQVTFHLPGHGSHSLGMNSFTRLQCHERNTASECTHCCAGHGTSLVL